MKKNIVLFVADQMRSDSMAHMGNPASITPHLDQLAEEVHEDDLKICKMDVDENPNTARQFGIMSIPTLLFKKDGQVVKQVAGVHTKAQLKEIIAELS